MSRNYQETEEFKNLDLETVYHTQDIWRQVLQAEFEGYPSDDEDEGGDD